MKNKSLFTARQEVHTFTFIIFFIKLSTDNDD